MIVFMVRLEDCEFSYIKGGFVHSKLIANSSRTYFCALSAGAVEYTDWISVEG